MAAYIERPRPSWFPEEQRRLFRCADCRKELSRNHFGSVEIGADGSGGRKTLFFRHPRCYSCRKVFMRLLEKHPLYTPQLGRFSAKLISSTRSASGPRGPAFLVEPDDVISLYIGQQGRCAISAVPMELAAGSAGAINQRAMSIDRVDSDGNYTPDNIQLVCASVNLMKRDMTMDQFVEWCARIAIHQAGKTAPAA